MSSTTTMSIEGRTAVVRAVKIGKAVEDPVSDDMWQLLYWPAKAPDGSIIAGAGRGEYLRVIFEEMGVEYENVSAGLREFFWENHDAQPYPVLSPPTIRKGQFILSQTVACAKYLAVEFGIYPQDPVDAAHSDQIVTMVHDTIGEGRNAFHPVKNTMSYIEQKEEAKPYIEEFATLRMPRYLNIFERFLKANAERGEFFIGSSLTYVDLQVMVMLQVTRSQFSDHWPTYDAPMLKAFLDRMEARPNMAAYLSSDRRRPFSGDSMM